MSIDNTVIHYEKIDRTLSYVFRNLYTTGEIIRLINGLTRRNWADDMCKLRLLQKVEVNTLYVKHVYLITSEGLSWLKTEHPKFSAAYDAHGYLRKDKIADRIHTHDFEKQHIAIEYQKLFNEKFTVRHGSLHRPSSSSENFYKCKEFDSVWTFGNKLKIGIEHERNGKYQIDLLKTFRKIQHSLDIGHVDKVLIFTDENAIFRNYEKVINGQKFNVSQEKSWKFSRGSDVQMVMYEGFK